MRANLYYRHEYIYIYIYMIFGPIGFNYTTRGSMIDGGNEDKDGRKKLRLLDQV